MWEVGEDIRQGRLQVVLPEWTPQGHAIYAIYPHSRLMPTRVRIFIDYLAEKYGPTPYWERGQEAANAAADVPATPDETATNRMEASKGAA